MRHLLALASFPLLAACHDSDSGGGAPLLANHRLAAGAIRGHGELWVAEVDELAQGQGSLNRDLDDLDVVPSVLDLATGTLTSLGVARGFSPLLAVGDVLVALGVSEVGQGASDLNGDGDVLDIVLHVYDSGTRVTTNTGLAMGFFVPAIGAGAVVFAVSEEAQDGLDLDGSGSAVGNVLHVYDARTRLTRNAQRNVTSNPVFHDHAFAFTTDEPTAGADLNGDGDQDDVSVFQTYDLVVGGIVSVPLAVTGVPVGAVVENWYVLADEAAQGQDLNDDLDLVDAVLLAVEPHLGTLLATGITAFPVPLGFSDGERLAFFASEADGGDRNGDGDLDDQYPALIQPGQAPTFIADVPLVFSKANPLALTPEQLGFLVSEQVAGDVNGNGITGESILFLMSTATGAVTTPAAEALTLDTAGDHLLFLRFESNGTIQEDRNGDGDTDDAVYSSYDARIGALGSTALAAFGPLVTAESAVLVPCIEMDQGTDLNGDGDKEDLVWVRHVLATGANTSLAAASLLPDTAGLTDDGRGVLLVPESDQVPAPGTDLNGDGDTADLVLHSFRAP